MPQAYPARHGLARSSPTPGLAAGSPVGRASPSHHQSSDDDGVSTDTSVMIWKRSYGYQIFYICQICCLRAQVLHMTDSKLHLF